MPEQSTNRPSLNRRHVLALAGGLAAGTVLAKPLFAAPAQPSLGGQPFSPPDAITPMPASWLEKGISRPQGADLMLAIDQQIYPALIPLAMNWAQRNGVKLATQEGTCGLASAALSDKSADITGMCCPPGVIDRLPGVKYHTIGISPVALIVNPANPLKDITWEQARALFSGTTRNWSDLPMSGILAKGEVRAVTRLHCKPRPGHWHLLIGNPDDYARQALDVPAIKDMIMEVAQTKDAIGWETLYHIADNASQGHVKTLKLNGVDPSDLKAAAAGKYPFYRVMGITTWENAPAANSLAAKLAAEMMARLDEIDPRFGIVPATKLRQAGWKFQGEELVGEIG